MNNAYGNSSPPQNVVTKDQIFRNVAYTLNGLECSAYVYTSLFIFRRNHVDSTTWHVYEDSLRTQLKIIECASSNIVNLYETYLHGCAFTFMNYRLTDVGDIYPIDGSGIEDKVCDILMAHFPGVAKVYSQGEDFEIAINNLCDDGYTYFTKGSSSIAKLASRFRKAGDKVLNNDGEYLIVLDLIRDKGGDASKDEFVVGLFMKAESNKLHVRFVLINKIGDQP